MRQNETLKDYFSFTYNYLSDNDFDINSLKSRDIKYCLHFFEKSDLKDFRQENLVTYKFESMVMMIVLSLVCWKTASFLEMARWCKLHRKEMKRWGIIKGDKTPSHDTFRRFVMLFDPKPLRNEINSLIEKMFKMIAKKSKAELPTMNQLSADGKELRGTGRSEGTKNPQKNLATLNLYMTSLGVCINDIAITEKESEIPTLLKAIEQMNLKNTVITADALHCQRNTCDEIKKKKGHYVFIVKKNQQELREEIKARFEKTKSEKTEHYEMSKRAFDVLPLKNISKKYLGTNWPGQKAYVKMISNAGGRKNNEEMYFITDLNDSKQICEVICNRWEIEGDYHYGKDMLLSEDEWSFANKAMAGNIAVYNSIIMALYKVTMMLCHFKSPSYARMFIASDPSNNIPLILESLNGKSLKAEIEKIQNQNKKS